MLTFTPNERESDPFTWVVDKWVSSNKREEIIIGFRGSGRRYNELLHMGGEGPGQFLQLQLGCGLHGRFSERRPYLLEGKNFPFHLYNI